MIIKNLNADLNVENLIKNEIERITNKLGKEYLTVKDIMVLTGMGRDYAYKLLSDENFPSYGSGNRKMVSVSSFVTWQFLTAGGLQNGK